LIPLDQIAELGVSLSQNLKLISREIIDEVCGYLPKYRSATVSRHSLVH